MLSGLSGLEKDGGVDDGSGKNTRSPNFSVPSAAPQVLPLLNDCCVLLATMLASYVLGASCHSLAPQAMQSHFVLLLDNLQ